MECVDKDVIPGEYEEEILVLKSIFNEDFLSIDNENSSYIFDLIIRFDSLPKKLLLIHEEMNTELSYLPPITLRVKYKKTIYPPDYCISCDYLTSDQLFFIANQMDSMGTSGEVIVYSWIEFIKDYLYHMDNGLVLSSIESSRNDQRFATNYNQIGSKRIYEQLMEYNQIQTQLEFDQTYHLCPICLEDKLGKTCLQFEQCRHYACRLCLNSFAKEWLLNIQQKNQMTCYQCNTSLNLPEIRRILSDEKLFLKYQQHFVDMINCPRCHHSIVCIPSESLSGNHPSFVECLYCQFTFCRRCEDSWHPQIQCPKEKLVQEMMQNPVQKPSQLNRIELKKLLLEIESILTIEGCSKPCPSCGVRIEKNGGCQHMHCRACQVHFCWLCGWFGPAYVPHPCAPKREKLEVTLPDYIKEKILYDENGKIIQADKLKRVQMCPRPFCREVNLKIGTKNMIICAKCQKCFCFLCGEAIYGLFHFSEYGCKANTAFKE